MSPKTAFVVLSIFGSVACGGSVPPPNDQWAAAQADVGRAQSGGAPEYPFTRSLADRGIALCGSILRVMTRIRCPLA
jgi:hypothetical protein